MKKVGYIYLINNQVGVCYLGSTNNYKRRLIEHNSGKHKSTSNKGPWEYKHVWKVSSLKNARKLEHYIKSWKIKLTIENTDKAIKHFLTNRGS